MRVMLAHKFHHLTGGAEVFYFEVAKALKKHGHQVAFFSTEADENIDTGDKLFEVPTPTYNSPSKLKKVLGSLDIVYSFRKKREMIEAIKEFKPDLIHAFAIHVHLTPSILAAAKEANVPVVMSCNDYKHICPNYKLYADNKLCEACKGGRFYNAIVKNCCKNNQLFSVASALEAYTHEVFDVYQKLVDRYLFSSNFMLEKTKEFWVDKVVDYGVLKNPFDAYEYSPVFGGEFGLYFGRIIDEKGVDVLISAIEKTNIPFKVVGDGPSFNQLKDYVSKKKIEHIEFLGPLWGEELKKVLIKAKFVVVPSLWHENFPYVIFQAFASGKPVVGSLRGGIPELIGDEERGLVFDPSDQASLVSAINKVWYEDGVAENLGKAAREYVEQEFSDENFYRDLIKNYKAVLK